MQRLPFSCSITDFYAAKTTIIGQAALQVASMRFEVGRLMSINISSCRPGFRPWVTRLLALLFLREEVEQPNNAQIGDDPQQKRDDHRQKGNVGLW